MRKFPFHDLFNRIHYLFSERSRTQTSPSLWSNRNFFSSLRAWIISRFRRGLPFPFHFGPSLSKKYSALSGARCQQIPSAPSSPSFFCFFFFSEFSQKEMVDSPLGVLADSSSGSQDRCLLFLKLLNPSPAIAEPLSPYGRRSLRRSLSFAGRAFF